ncbi:MAG: Uncharacterised protein [Methanobacteriota archaeon]|nr:MAG: Uncharacterised protein [Euryarchaeota archaeon]
MENPIKATRIRGRHRRLILIQLAVESGTVTEIAQRAGLHVPHVSTELKRMRQEGLIELTDSPGSRGASLALTPSGFNMLESDELSRLTEELFEGQKPKSGAVISILGRDALLVISDRVESSIVHIPLIDGSWTIAETRERSSRHYNQMFERMDGHLGTNPESLEGWLDARFGLLRIRLLDDAVINRIALNRWVEIETGFYSQEHPLSSDPSAWQLGRVGRDGPPALSVNSVVSQVASDEVSMQLIQIASNGAFSIGRRRILQRESTPLPIEILSDWIEIVHPRLRPQARSSRLVALHDHILRGRTGGRARRVSDVTLRRFKDDFGGREFTEQWVDDYVTINDLSTIGIQALLVWALNRTISMPLVLDVPTPLPDVLSRRIHRSEDLRLLIAPWSTIQMTRGDRLEHHPIHRLPDLRWIRSDGTEGIVHIGYGAPSLFRSPPGWRVPDSPEVLDEMSTVFTTSMRPPLNEDNPEEQILYACSVHGDGDEKFANSIERVNPLAAWIASSDVNRIDRWQRTHDRIENHWSSLLAVDQVPLSRISEIIWITSDDWRLALDLHLNEVLLVDDEMRSIMRRIALYAEDEETRSWASGRLLSIAQWLTNAEAADLLRWGIDSWSKSPPSRCSDALSGISYLQSMYPESRKGSIEKTSESLIRRSYTLPVDHDLQLWRMLAHWNEFGSAPDTRDIIRIIQYLPWSWWSSHAAEVLTILTESESGRSALSLNQAPWPALLFLPPDSEVPLPLAPPGIHPGFRPSLSDRIQRLLSSARFDEAVQDSLTDAAQAIEDMRADRPPRPGTTHRHVGWLCRPVEQWPSSHHLIDADGSPAIMQLLGRVSARTSSDIASVT